MNFNGKRVIVTGATRGIGLATAEAFLAAGATVAINGRTEQSVSTAMKNLTGNMIAAPGDVSKADDCDRMIDGAVKALGGLDVLVNNAGVFYRGTIEETDAAAWDYVMDANLKGLFLCSRAALPALKASKGNIVHVASESGLNGYAETSAYCASKGAVVNLTRSMAMELAPTVRVNCVCPGAVETDMARVAFAINGDQDAGLQQQRSQYPVGRIGTPQEIATGILYLASQDAGFINGAALPMEGGATAGG